MKIQHSQIINKLHGKIIVHAIDWQKPESLTAPYTASRNAEWYNPYENMAASTKITDYIYPLTQQSHLWNLSYSYTCLFAKSYPTLL